MRKFLLLLCALFISAGTMFAQDEPLKLTFDRSGTTKESVNVIVNGVTGAEAKLNSVSHGLMETKEDVTSSILCPNVNASAKPTITFSFTITDLPADFKFNTIGLCAHALNNEGKYQGTPTDFNKKTEYNIAFNVNDDNNENYYIQESDVNINVNTDGYHKLNWSKSASPSITVNDGELTLLLTITKGSNNSGCFFGLEYITLSYVTDFRDDIEAFLTEDKITNVNNAGQYGYPKTSTQSYSDIKDFIERWEAKSEDDEWDIDDYEEVQAYYAAYLAEENIVKPETGKFYRIYAEHPSRGKKYLKASENKATCVRPLDPNDASFIWYYGEDNNLTTFSTGYQLTSDLPTLACEANHAIEFKKSETLFGVVNMTYYNNMTSKYDMLFIEAGNDANTYLTTSTDNDAAGVRIFVEEVEALPITISEAGYATLYSPVALEIADGVTAYTGTLNDDESALKLTPVEGTIPANTPVVLEGTRGDYPFNITTTDETIEENALKGSMGIADATGLLVLQVFDDQIGFYTYNNAEGLPAFKAYIDLTGINSNALRVVFDDDITAIEGVETADSDAAAYYDLQGRRVAAPQAGQLYIVNGKKILVK